VPRLDIHTTRDATRYPEAVQSQPAVTVRAIVAGLRALGLDADAALSSAGITEGQLEPLDAMVPVENVWRLWKGILERARREEFPVELGLAVPYGAYGTLDYLAGSSDDVRSGFQSLADYFRLATPIFRLELVPVPDGGEVRLVRIYRYPSDFMSWVVSEFILSVCVGHFASQVPGFSVTEVRLTRPAAADASRLEQLLGARVVLGCSVGALRIPGAAWKAPIPHANPLLRETLRRLAVQIELGAAGSDLELAIRARLRSLLPGGGCTASALARSLGRSERTLHRRLLEVGRTYQEVLDAFRESEAERLLASGDVRLSEAALRLGFADQSTFTRAFKRWKGMSPTKWADSRGR
jgi:AraC-like DNA-binding protein